MPSYVNFRVGGLFLLFGIASTGRLAKTMRRALAHESSRTFRSAHCHPSDEPRYAPGSASIGRACVPDVSFPGCTTTASVSLSFAMHSVW